MLLALTDMQGRLQGKRLSAQHFLETVVEHGAEACNYLLAIDVEMNTVGGYEMSSWERGYGDFEMQPDFDTLRSVPWLEGTALCLADLAWADGEPVVASPRQILRRQLDRLAERGLEAIAATELEFILFKTPYEEAADARLPRPRAGQPLQPRLLDPRHLAGRAGDPPHPQLDGRRRPARSRTPRASATSASTRSTSRTARRCSTADEHSIYKNGAKEIAAQEGMAITFMAKFNEREGSSCHIHLSLRREDGTPLFADDTQAFDRFVAGQLACMRELTLFFAPNINSYKRYAEGSLRPDRGRLGRGQPHVLAARGRPRRRAAGSSRASRAPTSTPTSRSPR